MTKMMKERIDFNREFDAKLYDDKYFVGGDRSAYGDYSKAKGIVETQYQAIHNAMINIPHKQTVLDLGTAYGYGAAKLRSLGWKQVAGLDISEHAIAKARKLHQDDPELSFDVCDIQDADAFKEFTDKEFGMAVGCELLEHIPSSSVPAFFKNVARVADWGLFVINARSSAKEQALEEIEHAKGDHGHLNHNSMTWWIKEASKVGDIDYEQMYKFGAATAQVDGVNWHTRCLVIRFN